MYKKCVLSKEVNESLYGLLCNGYTHLDSKRSDQHKEKLNYFFQHICKTTTPTVLEYLSNRCTANIKRSNFI